MKPLLNMALCFATLFSQAQTIERQVVGSTGGTATSGNIIVTSTVGELAVSTQTSTNIILTEGYQQASDTNLISVKEIESITVMKLYPNPTRTSSNLEITANKDNVVAVTIYSAQGKLIKNSSFQLSAGKQSTIELDITNQASGVYFVKLTGENNAFNKTMRLVKQ